MTVECLLLIITMIVIMSTGHQQKIVYPHKISRMI